MRALGGMIVNLMVFLGVAVLTVGFMTVGLGILAGLARVMLIGGRGGEEGGRRCDD